MTEPASDQERLVTLLAMLPWQHAPDGLFPPDALRRVWLRVDADTTPEFDADRDHRWAALTNVAAEFDRVLAADTTATPATAFVLAMRVLDTFEPPDADVARVIGTLLPATTAGRLWLDDIAATAWRIVSSTHGTRRLAELRHPVR